MKTLVNFILFLAYMPRRTPRLGMALIKLGGGVADIRGSIGGTTFSRNRYGNYSRNRTIPVNPSSSYQQKIRSSISVARNAWFSVLTAAQRTAWGAYAAAVAVQNRLGESINLTGWNHFCRSATAMLYADLDYIAAGPVELSLPETDPTFAAAASAATQNLSITFDNTADWANETGSYMLIFSSPGNNITRNFYKGPYRYAGKITGNDSTPPTSPATVASPFTVTAGQKIFCQARIVREDGRLSAPFRCSLTAGA